MDMLIVELLANVPTFAGLAVAIIILWRLNEKQQETIDHLIDIVVAVRKTNGDT